MLISNYCRANSRDGRQNSLSRAGRLTFAQSVLSSIPLFYMQFERPPTWLHKEIDKAIRRCVWVKKGDTRGVHLLSWERLVKPKKLGGANLKSAMHMNMAMLAKLRWRMIANKEEL